MSKKELNPKQELFVEEYLVDFNAARAAARAGYSPRRAQKTGSDLLALPHVREAVDARLARRVDELQVKQDHVVKALARIAFSDILDFCDWGPGGVTLRPADELLPGASTAIESVTHRRSETGRTETRVTLRSKMRALEMLGRHLGLFPGLRSQAARDGVHGGGGGPDTGEPGIVYHFTEAEAPEGWDEQVAEWQRQADERDRQRNERSGGGGGAGATQTLGPDEPEDDYDECEGCDQRDECDERNEHDGAGQGGEAEADEERN